jgi:hypothetical protein
MLIPLKQFYCDTCGQVIDSPDEGYTEWVVESGYCKDFKIIHNKPYSPHKEAGCSQYMSKEDIIDGSIALDRMISLGLPKLLSFLNDGNFARHNTRSRIKEKDLKNFIDFFSRLIIPYYEEARKHFAEAGSELFQRELSGVDIYDLETLEKIAKEFSRD